MSEQTGNSLVGLAGTIGGFSVAIVAIIAIFAKEQLVVAPWIVGALVVMGIFLGMIVLRMKKSE